MNTIFRRLFDKTKVHPSVKKIYATIDPQIKNKLFYGDLSVFNQQLLRITELSFNETTDTAINSCFQIYMQVFIRSHGGFSPEFSTPQYITEKLCQRFASIPSQIVMNCINQSLEYIYKNEPELEKKIQMYESIKNFVLENARKNQHLFDLHLKDDDYGLVSHKPIFVAGFDGAKAYLAQLVNMEGLSPMISRLGSVEINGISGAVDLYVLSFDNDQKLHIYVCNYGLTNSVVTPVGLRFKNQ